MPLDLPDDPLGREFVTLIARLQYERDVSNKIADLLDREFTRLVDLLLTQKYRDLTKAQQVRTAQLFQELAKRIKQSYRDLTDVQLQAMKGYAQLEAELARETVTHALSVGGSTATIDFGPFLPRNYLSSIARLPIQGLNIGQWFDAQAASMTLKVRQIIQQGLIEGRSPAQIASRIQAGSAAKPSVLARQARRDAVSISRTITNAVQNDAQFNALKALPNDVSNSYIYEAVLDSRTTPICRALSGRVWRYDDPSGKRPPQHVSCRSTIRSLLIGIDKTLTEQGVTRSVNNYATWLKKQSTTKQNAILGPTRAGLWRDGKMTLSDAVSQDGRVLTLNQLRETLGLSQ